MNYAGLIFDDSRHYLDHLGPFCALLKCPLIVCEPEIAQIATHFYPDLEVRLISIWDLKLPKYTISCDPRPLLQAAFPGQSTQILWLPHGNSDKGWSCPFFEGLSGEIALVYGQRMIDFMHKKNVFPKLIRTGNFRWEYFCKNHKKKEEAPILQGKEKSMICNHVMEELTAPLKDRSKKFLYAPTWDDAEKNNSFWQAFPSLAKNLPKSCNLFVKLHPNTIRKFGPEIEVIAGRYSKKQNISFLPNDPPIYPILSRFAAYIGDMSSIGYDFLAFNRPMFFLNSNLELALHRCGTAINPQNFDYSFVEDFSKAREELYAYTFDSSSNWKGEIHALCSL